jgi:hypothetical protein
MHRMQAVDFGPLLKTSWRSLYKILYFAVLLDHFLVDIYSASHFFFHFCAFHEQNAKIDAGKIY